MRRFGIDEAGRGPVLGPLVVAVASVPSEIVCSLPDFGVRDSKQLGSGRKAHERRVCLCEEIRRLGVEGVTVSFDAATVDRYVHEGRLNALEREGAATLLHGLGALSTESIVCDGAMVFGPLRRTWSELTAEDHADANHAEVAAASLFAKVARDQAMDDILGLYAEEFGVIGGGGYVNAPTLRFLDEYQRRYGTLPPEARKSWRLRSRTGRSE